MEDIVRKISRIIAKAESTTSLAEAETFMAKAHQMLEEHSLSMLDVATLDADDPVGHDAGSDTYGNTTSYLIHVASGLARYYGCNTIISTRGAKKTITIIGRESNRKTFLLMYPFVKAQLFAVAAEVMRSEGITRQSARRQVGNALTFRLARLVNENAQRDAQRVAETGSRALVPVDMLEAQARQLFPNMRAGRKSQIGAGDAARRAAEGISLSRQATGKKTLRLA